MTRTFGMSYGRVVEHVDCPRCGSPAVIRNRKRPNTDIHEEHLTCNKCHNVLFVGMSLQGYHDQKTKLDRLLRIRKKLTIPKDIRRLDAKIADLKERMALDELTRANGFAVRVTPSKEDT